MLVILVLVLVVLVPVLVVLVLVLVILVLVLVVLVLVLVVLVLVLVVLVGLDTGLEVAEVEPPLHPDSVHRLRAPDQALDVGAHRVPLGGVGLQVGGYAPASVTS